MKISLLFFYFLYCTISIALKPITGTVTENSDIPVLRATVLIKGTDNEINTDIDGYYSIEVRLMKN
ncbi:carboxypeptidase-like regulatory domain-containing protein [Nonlabens ulvanivorans]|uniref:carboxypeptidase-like regulatory domain-containing protein n=1 Tax=Nonlabens ulvanivorans TaxID=906888 RepID=UPI0037CC6F4D